MTYKPGDRVRWVLEYTGKSKNYIGLTGTVKQIIDTGQIGVAWDKYMEGHNLDYCLNGKQYCEHGYGWYMWPHNIQKLEPEVDKEYEELLV